MLTDLFLRGRHMPFLDGEDKGGGGGGETEKTAEELAAEAEEAEIQKRTDLNESGKAVLRAERAAKREAERKAADLQTQLDAANEKERQREAAEQTARDEEARKKGEFETLAQTREQERDTAIGERDAAREQIKKLEDTLKAGLAEQWAALPEEVRKIGEKAHPADDILGRYGWLTDPDTKALVAKIEGTGTGARREGNGPVPPPRNDGRRTSDDDEAVRARNAGRYS